MTAYVYQEFQLRSMRTVWLLGNSCRDRLNLLLINTFLWNGCADQIGRMATRDCDAISIGQEVASRLKEASVFPEILVVRERWDLRKPRFQNILSLCRQSLELQATCIYTQDLDECTEGLVRLHRNRPAHSDDVLHQVRILCRQLIS